MRLSISIFLTSMIITVFGQVGEDGGVIRKQEKYYLNKTCYDIIKWDEIVLKNKVVANKINSVIRKSVSSYKLTKDDAALLCDKSTDFSRTTEFKVVYQKNNFISYYLASDTYYKGVLHDFHQFSTLNFDSKTGDQISFNDLIDTMYLPTVDSLIMRKITLQLPFHGVDSSELKSQLQKKAFNLKENGIEILYGYSNYPMGILLPYKELEPFGLLRRF